MSASTEYPHPAVPQMARGWYLREATYFQGLAAMRHREAVEAMRVGRTNDAIRHQHFHAGYSAQARLEYDRALAAPF